VRSGAVEFEAREFEECAIQGKFHHRQTVEKGSDGLALLVGRVGGKQPEQALEAELVEGCPAEGQMTEMWWVEGPAEESDEHD
jgi:hypothetical protein